MKTRVKNVLSYRKPAMWVILAAVVLCIAAAVCFLTKPGEREPIFGYRYAANLTLYEHITPFCDVEVRKLMVDGAGNLYLTTYEEGAGKTTWKAGLLEEYRPTKLSFDYRYQNRTELVRRKVRLAYRCVFSMPEVEELVFADLLELRNGSVWFTMGWQDEEGLTDEYSDDSRTWIYGEIHRYEGASFTERPSVENCVAAVLQTDARTKAVIVTGEIDSLKTFDSLILEPTGETFTEPWEYSIVFDPASVVKGKEPIEVLFGAESVGIDGWKYVSPNMAGLLEWVEGKFAYFSVTGDWPAEPPELRVAGEQENTQAERVSAWWDRTGTLYGEFGFMTYQEDGTWSSVPVLPLTTDAVLKTVVHAGTHRDAYRTVHLTWEDAAGEPVKTPETVLIRCWETGAESWDGQQEVPTDGTSFELLDGCHIYEITAYWSTLTGLESAQYCFEGQYLAFADSSDGLWRRPPMLSATGNGEAAQLWQGTQSWSYDFGGIDVGGYELDCASPWLLMKDQPEYIPTLTAFAGDRVFILPEPGGDTPTRLSVSAIDPSQWGEIAPERTEIELSADGSFTLPDGEYLYEVTARWQEEGYHGSCWYAFYCDSRSAKTGVVERMGSSTRETILEIFSRYPVDENALSEALHRASEAGTTEAAEAFTGYYEIEVYFSGGAAGFTGDDEHLHLRAGLEENLVEVFFKPRLGKTETRYFRDKALYDIVRENGYEMNNG